LWLLCSGFLFWNLNGPLNSSITSLHWHPFVDTNPFTWTFLRHFQLLRKTFSVSIGKLDQDFKLQRAIIAEQDTPYIHGLDTWVREKKIFENQNFLDS
jgi:hypothetical protein